MIVCWPNFLLYPRYTLLTNVIKISYIYFFLMKNFFWYFKGICYVIFFSSLPLVTKRKSTNQSLDKKLENFHLGVFLNLRPCKYFEIDWKQFFCLPLRAQDHCDRVRFLLFACSFLYNSNKVYLFLHMELIYLWRKIHHLGHFLTSLLMLHGPVLHSIQKIGQNRHYELMYPTICAEFRVQYYDFDNFLQTFLHVSQVCFSTLKH